MPRRKTITTITTTTDETTTPATLDDRAEELAEQHPEHLEQPPIAHFVMLPAERAERAKVQLSAIEAQLATLAERATARAERLAALDAAEAELRAKEGELADENTALIATARLARAEVLIAVGSHDEESAQRRLQQAQGAQQRKAEAHARAGECARVLARENIIERERLAAEETADAAEQERLEAWLPELQRLLSSLEDEAGELRFVQVWAEVQSAERAANHAREALRSAESWAEGIRSLASQALLDEGYPEFAAKMQAALYPAPSSHSATIEILEAGAAFISVLQKHAGQVPMLVLRRHNLARLFDWESRFAIAMQTRNAAAFAMVQRSISDLLAELRTLEREELAQRAAAQVQQRAQQERAQQDVG